MTKDQFCVWLLFALPALCCLLDLSKSFLYRLVAAAIMSIFPLMLFIIAENEFIKGCKKGYTDWEESIIPQWFYKGIKK